MAEKVIDGRSNIAKSVKTEIYDTLRNSLIKPNGKTKKSWTQNFVEELLKEAKSNPNSAIGQILAKQIMSDGLIEKLDEQTDKYLSRDLDFNEFRIMKSLYHEQQEVFNDRQNKKIAIIGSRRIGKTELCARLLLRDCLKPNRHAVFISLKFENAIRQCYPICIDLATALGLPIEKASKVEGEILFANGSNILFKGNNDKAAADKLLGYKYSCACIDEVQNQCNLMYLLDTVLGPAMTDYPDSQLYLIGTPPRIPHTAIEKIWKEYKGWKKYSWTMESNPYLSNTEEYINSLCEQKGITKDAPFIKREYYAEWLWDTESMVIKDPLLYEGNNEYVIKQIKEGKFHADYVYGGVDFGFSDNNAIVTIAWDKQRKMGYVLNNYKFNKATVTEIVEKMKYSLAEAQEVLIKSLTNPHNIMYYGDNSDKSIIYELSVNYNFPIQCAYKHDKMEALSALAELFRRYIYTPKSSPLFDDFEQTVYKRDEETDAILSELDDNAYHADVLMAALYASRQLVFDENPLGKDDTANAKKYDDAYTKMITPEQDDSYLMPDGTYGR